MISIYIYVVYYDDILPHPTPSALSNPPTLIVCLFVIYI